MKQEPPAEWLEKALHDIAFCLQHGNRVGALARLEQHVVHFAASARASAEKEKRDIEEQAQAAYRVFRAEVAEITQQREEALTLLRRHLHYMRVLVGCNKNCKTCGETEAFLRALPSAPSATPETKK